MAKFEKCKERYGGWVPGRAIVSTPSFLGRPIGKRSPSAVNSFVVMVHFNNPELKKHRKSNDGIQIFYTPTLRSETTGIFRVLELSANSRVVIPPKKPRWFITRRCEISYETNREELPGGEQRPFHLVSNWMHGHLIASEMYLELFKDRPRFTKMLRNDRAWHFSYQSEKNLLQENHTITAGDVLQVTCVFNSTARSEPTRIGVDTVSEMCWGTLLGYPGEVANSLKCTGHIWTGELNSTEEVEGFSTNRHPESAAFKNGTKTVVLDGSKHYFGGNVIGENDIGGGNEVLSARSKGVGEKNPAHHPSTAQYYPATSTPTPQQDFRSRTGPTKTLRTLYARFARLAATVVLLITVFLVGRRVWYYWAPRFPGGGTGGWSAAGRYGDMDSIIGASPSEVGAANRARGSLE